MDSYFWVCRNDRVVGNRNSGCYAIFSSQPNFSPARNTWESEQITMSAKDFEALFPKLKLEHGVGPIEVSISGKRKKSGSLG